MVAQSSSLTFSASSLNRSPSPSCYLKAQKKKKKIVINEFSANIRKKLKATTKRRQKLSLLLSLSLTLHCPVKLKYNGLTFHSTQRHIIMLNTRLWWLKYWNFFLIAVPSHNWNYPFNQHLSNLNISHLFK